jgi:NifB/MoaA-like Fe-S oxidoreductase
VPLGYTKYSKRFSESYSDHPEAAAEVIRIIEPYQRRSREERGLTCFQLSDEFYVAAQRPVPDAEFYDGYPQFYDGIGMLRSFLDEIDAVRGGDGAAARAAGALRTHGKRALVVCGEAALGVVDELVAIPELEGLVASQAIRNDFYGGDVNVTGLIVACDLLAQLDEDLANTVVVLPESMLNFDKVTLDDVSLDELREEIARRGGSTCVLRTSPSALCVGICEAVAEGASR